MQQQRPGSDFLPALKDTLNDPAAGLRFNVADLLGLLGRGHVEGKVRDTLPQKPSMMSHLPTILGSMGASQKKHWADVMPSDSTLSLVSMVFKHNSEVYRYEKKRATLERILRQFVIIRPAVSLSDRDKGVTLAMGMLYAKGLIDSTDWAQFLGQLVWHDGATDLRLPKETNNLPEVAQARSMLFDLMKAGLPPYKQFIAQTAQAVAQFRHSPGSESKVIEEALSTGARWLTDGDLQSSKVFDPAPKPGGLLIGYLPDSGNPVSYSGDASLITIAAPNTGKTQGQVIPNLLSYPGSVFVLDVKGELWEATAGYRAQHFGPVFRFSPTNEDGRSHSYNPFDTIPADPRKAAPACDVLVNQLIPEPQNTKDRYWEDRARGFLWGFAMLVALEEPPERRNLTTIVEYLNLPLDYEGREDEIENSQAYQLATKLRQASHRYGIAEFDTLGTALEDGLTGQRLSSVFDVARSRLSGLVRSPGAAQAMALSHWSPGDLRERPGMSVYLSFKPGEINAFAGIIRLIFQQHADALTRDFRHSTTRYPITFFLDELPQLGELPSLNAILDVGRGAGLRLWMFAQFLGQLRDIYGKRADGIVGATQVRCFQQPDNDAAELLSGMLGKTRSLLDGEEKPLAYPHQLAGRQHGDKVVVVARGEHPSLLETRKAYAYESAKISTPPPPVPALSADNR